MTARIGLIGCGWWSTFAHLPALREHPDAEIAGLADPDRARLDAAASGFDVGATFPSAEALLDGVELDAVVIAVPHAHHYAVAKAALERGLHVLLEKPMTIEPAHARELVAMAGARGLEIVMGYPWQYNRHVLQLSASIVDGAIGELEYASLLYASIVRELYRGNPEPYREIFGYPVNPPAATTYSDPALAGGGQGQTQITHAAALLLRLTGLRPMEVTALSRDFELPVDLADSIAIAFEGGAIATLSSTGSMTAGQEELVRCEVFGREGHVQLDVNRGTASVHRDGKVERLADLPEAHRTPDDAPAQNLVDVALGRAANGAPAHIGLGAVEIVAAMYSSARERRIVQIEEV